MIESLYMNYGESISQKLDFFSDLGDITLRPLGTREARRINDFRGRVSRDIYECLNESGILDAFGRPNLAEIGASLTVAEIGGLGSFLRNQLRFSEAETVFLWALERSVRRLRSDGPHGVLKFLGWMRVPTSDAAQIRVRETSEMLYERREEFDQGLQEQIVRERFANTVSNLEFYTALQLLHRHPSILHSQIRNAFRVYVHHQRFDLAQQALEDAGREGLGRRKEPNPADFIRRALIVDLHRQLSFFEDVARFNAAIPQPAAPIGVVVTLVRNIRALRFVPLSVLMEAKKQGWAVVHLITDCLRESSDGGFEALQGYLGSECETTRDHPGRFEYIHDWTVDTSNRIASVDGINYWHGIYEHLSIGERLYHLDFDRVSTQKGFRSRLRQADRGLAACRKILEQVGGELPVRFLLQDVHTVPGHTIRTFCETEGKDHDMHVVNFKNAYETLFKDSALPVASTISLANVTRDNLRVPFLGTPAGFDKYFESVRKRFEASSSSPADVSPKTSAPREDQTRYLEDLARFRRGGGRVYCLLGKVVCDLAVPRDGGPAHVDMEDWVNHTIRTIAGISNIRLIVKPHPHELRHEIALFGAERFEDLIVESAPNMEILAPDFLSMDLLAPHLDLGLVWNGTSCIDLGVSRVPTLVAGHYAPIDYPVGQKAPNDREDYEHLLRSGVVESDLDEVRAKSQAFLEYIRSPSVSVPYGYSIRPATNRSVWPPSCIHEDFHRYLTEGDIHVSGLIHHLE